MKPFCRRCTIIWLAHSFDDLVILVSESEMFPDLSHPWSKAGGASGVVGFAPSLMVVQGGSLKTLLFLFWCYLRVPQCLHLLKISSSFFYKGWSQKCLGCRGEQVIRFRSVGCLIFIIILKDGLLPYWCAVIGCFSQNMESIISVRGPTASKNCAWMSEKRLSFDLGFFDKSGSSPSNSISILSDHASCMVRESSRGYWHLGTLCLWGTVYLARIPIPRQLCCPLWLFFKFLTYTWQFLLHSFKRLLHCCNGRCPCCYAEVTWTDGGEIVKRVHWYWELKE